MSNTMREIIFRGKTVDNREWVYGDPITILNREDVCGIRELTLLRQAHLCNKVTCGQYTGLTDKNGTKIFEGDIVTYDKEYIGETREKGIVYSCDGSFWVENIQDEEDVGLLGVRVKHQLEIISNIHDNPDLLEKM